MIRNFTLSALTFLLIFTLMPNLKAQQPNSFSMGFKLLPGTTKLLPFAEGGSYRFTMGYGMKAAYFTTNPSYGFETGIYIMDKGSSLEKEIYNSDGNYYDTDVINSHYYYVVVPLLFKYNFSQWYTDAGLTMEYFLKGHTSSVLIPETEPLEYYGDVNLGAMINIGYQNDFGRRLGYFAEFYFNPVLTDIRTYVRHNFLNFGIAMGMQYRLTATRPAD